VDGTPLLGLAYDLAPEGGDSLINDLCLAQIDHLDRCEVKTVSRTNSTRAASFGRIRAKA
jgi:hypothetical protein